MLFFALTRQMHVCVLDAGFFRFAVPVEQMPWIPRGTRIIPMKEWLAELREFRMQK